MGVRYSTVQLRNPLDPSAPKKHYVLGKSIGHIGRDDLIKEMVRNTSLTYMEAATGIDYLFDSIPRFLEWGFTVQLGALGYFKVGIRSEGSDTAEEVSPDKIKSMRLVFLPGLEIRKRVNSFSVGKFPT